MDIDVGSSDSCFRCELIETMLSTWQEYVIFCDTSPELGLWSYIDALNTSESFGNDDVKMIIAALNDEMNGGRKKRGEG